jgi:hypothetical protein
LSIIHSYTRHGDLPLDLKDEEAEDCHDSFAEGRVSGLVETKIEFTHDRRWGWRNEVVRRIASAGLPHVNSSRLEGEVLSRPLDEGVQVHRGNPDVRLSFLLKDAEKQQRLRSHLGLPSVLKDELACTQLGGVSESIKDTTHVFGAHLHRDPQVPQRSRRHACYLFRLSRISGTVTRFWMLAIVVMGIGVPRSFAGIDSGSPTGRT